MKRFIFLGVLMWSVTSLAINPDSTSGKIKCKGRGTFVELNAARTSFTVTRRNQPQVYDVVSRTNYPDNNKIVYTGQYHTAHFTREALLTFTNIGDSLQVDGRGMTLFCSR